MKHQQLILNFSHPELSPDAPCYESYSNYEILNKAGKRFVEVAQDIKQNFESWWIDWSNPTELGDCLLPEDWEDIFLSKYLQHSIDVSFLNKYLIDTPRLSHDYPESRAMIIQEDNEYESLFTPDEITEVLTTAPNSESIKEWSNIVLKVFTEFPEIKFSYLLNLVQLSPAKIYLSVLLSDRFILRKDSDDFYGDFSIVINMQNCH
ncbi:MAG: hypothetical protein QNJ65_17995 [Xenococcaceae cyanobacterium MO_234.B1]|nr:hypothetical protein [Xenococcaceae cyanobacterium MO_234.B1]